MTVETSKDNPKPPEALAVPQEPLDVCADGPLDRVRQEDVVPSVGPSAFDDPAVGEEGATPQVVVLAGVLAPPTQEGGRVDARPHCQVVPQSPVRVLALGRDHDLLFRQAEELGHVDKEVALVHDVPRAAVDLDRVLNRVDHLVRVGHQHGEGDLPAALSDERHERLHHEASKYAAVSLLDLLVVVPFEKGGTGPPADRADQGHRDGLPRPVRLRSEVPVKQGAFLPEHFRGVFLLKTTGSQSFTGSSHRPPSADVVWQSEGHRSPWPSIPAAHHVPRPFRYCLAARVAS
jgi:hypothetical protein